MMRRSMALGLALAVFLFAARAQAQGELPENLGSNDSQSREIGSASVLEGSVGIYHVFVSESMAEWTDSDVELALTNVEQALMFLNYHAELHGRELYFQQEAIQVVYDAGVPIELTADPQWTERVIQATGAMSGNDLAATLRDAWGVDQVLIALHVNKTGLSYALAYVPGADPTYSSERVVLFTRYPDTRPTAAATYAHEMMHLFGALDLYYPTDTDDSRRELAQRIFPDDIMLRVEYNLANLTVNDFTAYRVGWLDGLREAFHVFEN